MHPGLITKTTLRYSFTCNNHYLDNIQIHILQELFYEQTLGLMAINPSQHVQSIKEDLQNIFT